MPAIAGERRRDLGASRASTVAGTGGRSRAWHDGLVILDPRVPLLEFDGERSAVIEPAPGPGSVKAPVAAVACFFPEVVAEWAKNATSLLDLPARENLWEIEYRGQRLALFYPGTGAPLAASRLECVIAAGCRAIVACGAAGALVPDLDMGYHVISVTAAIRDEGTSYHYLEPARAIDVAPEVVDVLERVAHSRNEPYLAGMTWTTDGYFRETHARVARRRAEGCLTVEMEAAAMLAVARFRGVRLGHYLYAADDLTGEVWDHREWWNSPRRNDLTELAADAALALAGLDGLPGT